MTRTHACGLTRILTGRELGSAANHWLRVAEGRRVCVPSLILSVCYIIVAHTGSSLANCGGWFQRACTCILSIRRPFYKSTVQTVDVQPLYMRQLCAVGERHSLAMIVWNTHACQRSKQAGSRELKAVGGYLGSRIVHSEAWNTHVRALDSTLWPRTTADSQWNRGRNSVDL